VSAEHRPTTYELTVAGPLGPVVRAALAPHHALPSRAYTLMCTTTGKLDLVDVLHRLQQRGLVVEDVVETRTTSSTVHDARPAPPAQG
jgi:hypothetical protein